MSRSTLGTQLILYSAHICEELIICRQIAVQPRFCFEENPDVSSPVLGLGVLVFLLVVAVTLDFSGQSRMSHLRVVAHRFDADHLAFVSLILFPVFDLRGGGGGSMLAPRPRRLQVCHLCPRPVYSLTHITCEVSLGFSGEDRERVQTELEALVPLLLLLPVALVHFLGKEMKSHGFHSVFGLENED